MPDPTNRRSAVAHAAHVAVGAVALSLIVAACGGAEPAPTGAPAGPTAGPTSAAPTASAAPGDGSGGGSGGGSATVTVGDQTWDFDSALCAFGPEEIGQEGAEFVLSTTRDGVQFYLSIDSFGHSASVDDIANFADPTISFSSDDAAGEFITISGKDVSGATDFTDYTTDSLEGIPGTFQATCP